MIAVSTFSQITKKMRRSCLFHEKAFKGGAGLALINPAVHCLILRTVASLATITQRTPAITPTPETIDPDGTGPSLPYL